MANSTPGPWQWFTKLSGSENHRGFRIITDSQGLVADVMPRDEDGVIGEANARLIASSPELLAALRRIATASADDGGWLQQFPGWAQAEARAAIAKATGQEVQV